MKEKIGILGSGMVGQALAGGFAKSGYEVKVGTRDTSKLKEWLEKTGDSKISTGSFEETAKFGDIIVLATHGVATKNAIDIAGMQNFSGKIVIDVTNPLDFSEGFPPKFAASPGNSLGEQIQKHIPDAKVVKAFNIVNCYVMVSPKREDGMPDMFIAGNNKEAKKRVNELAKEWGWNECIDIGGIKEAFLLEALTMLWVKYAALSGEWSHAFKLLRK
jgi:8-hydroxy-5-deazaflavin:NADPH oxidoreductase